MKSRRDKGGRSERRRQFTIARYVCSNYRQRMKRPFYCATCRFVHFNHYGLVCANWCSYIKYCRKLRRWCVLSVKCARSTRKNASKWSTSTGFTAARCLRQRPSWKQKEHSGERLFVCPICNRMFQEYGQAVVHGIAIYSTEITPRTTADEKRYDL